MINQTKISGAIKKLSHREKPIKRWPVIIALLGIGGVFGLLSARVTNGYGWLVLPLVIIFLVPINLTHLRENHILTRRFALGITAVLTLAEIISIGFLLSALLNKEAMGVSLLEDAVLLWSTNFIVFSIWYWELDGGGPAERHKDLEYHLNSDFLFPQLTLNLDKVRNWVPIYLDYLFLAFNTNTAFSPTDTPVLSGRAKCLTMLQSGISLITLATFAARAINIL